MICEPASRRVYRRRPVKKSKSPGKRTSAVGTRAKAAKPLRDLKVTKLRGTGVRGGLIATEDYGMMDQYDK